MSVVINEFEVVPAQQAPAEQRAEPAPQTPPGAVEHEVERAVERRRERELRLRAD